MTFSPTPVAPDVDALAEDALADRAMEIADTGDDFTDPPEVATTVLAMLHAHDQEEAAQKGEPSPWDESYMTERDRDWELERYHAMKAAYKAFAARRLPQVEAERDDARDDARDAWSAHAAANARADAAEERVRVLTEAARHARTYLTNRGARDTLCITTRATLAKLDAALGSAS